MSVRRRNPTSVTTRTGEGTLGIVLELLAFLHLRLRAALGIIPNRAAEASSCGARGDMLSPGHWLGKTMKRLTTHGTTRGILGACC